MFIFGGKCRLFQFVHSCLLISIINDKFDNGIKTIFTNVSFWHSNEKELEFPLLSPKENQM